MCGPKLTSLNKNNPPRQLRQKRQQESGGGGRGGTKSSEEEAAFQISPRRREALPSLVEKNNVATGRRQWKHSAFDKLLFSDCPALKHEVCSVRARREQSRVEQRNVGQRLSNCVSALCFSLRLFSPRPSEWPSRLPPPHRLLDPAGGSSERRLAVQSSPRAAGFTWRWDAAGDWWIRWQEEGAGLRVRPLAQTFWPTSKKTKKGSQERHHSVQTDIVVMNHSI